MKNIELLKSLYISFITIKNIYIFIHKISLDSKINCKLIIIFELNIIQI